MAGYCVDILLKMDISLIRSSHEAGIMPVAAVTAACQSGSFRLEPSVGAAATQDCMLVM